MSERVCVYDVVYKGSVVYVGMTNNPDKRIKGHKYTGVVQEGSKMVVHKWYGSRLEAQKAELARQYELRPIYCRNLKGSISPPLEVPRPVCFDAVAAKKAIDEFNAKFTHEHVAKYIEFLKREISRDEYDQYLEQHPEQESLVASRQ